MKVKFEDVGGIPTRYYRAGEGYPLLLVHGVGVTADSWCNNIEALAQHFQVIAPDLLDNGFTGAGSYRLGPPHKPMLNHLMQLVDHLGLREFAVLGSSFGGLLAVHLHLRSPDRVNRLIVISSGSTMQSAETLTETFARAYANGRPALSDPTYALCHQRLANIFFDPRKIPRELVFLHLTAAARPGALASFDRRMKGLMDVEAIRPFITRERLREISAPTLSIWGKQDPRSDHAEALLKFSEIPDSKVILFDECGHLPHLEHPTRFNDAVVAFLTARRVD
jgi:2-hydroxy-6-oxonona-2,4-dienedioate hydrolase